MKKYLLAPVLALACLSANATVINFDGHTDTIYGDEDPSNGIASVSLNGFSFSNTGDHFHLVEMGGFSDPTNGTSSLLSDHAGPLTMTRDGGGTFSLSSLLGYAYFSSTLTVTGYFAAGGSINTDLAVNSETLTPFVLSGFTGLNRVVFSGSPETIEAPYGFGLDNLVVEAGPNEVPEPFTLGLVGLALGGLAFSRKKAR